MRLPRAAQRLMTATILAAIALSGLAAATDPRPASALPVLLLAAGIAVAEGFRVDLPYRRGGNASFTLGDAALAAALLVRPGTEVVLGAVFGILAWQIAERVAPVKLVFNAAQYVVGAAAAALTVQLLAPRPGPVDPSTLGAVAIGVALFLIANISTVSGMISFTGGDSWAATARRIAPTAALLAAGNTALGLLAVLLAGSAPWALPAMAVPLALLFGASRQEIGAQVDRERSVAFVAVEQRLGEAVTPETVCDVLAAGVTEILGCQAAVWRDTRWVTPVPEGSGPCPVDPELDVALTAGGRTLGPAVDGACVAVGVGEAVLVSWQGDLGVTREAEDWLERLARSGRASFDRAAAHVALRQERATLRAVIDGTGDGIFVLDAEGTIRLWNPAMAHLAAIPASHVLGRRANEVLEPGPWTEVGVHDVTRPGSDHVWRVSIAQVSGRALFFGGAASSADLRIALVHDVTAERRVARMKDDMMAVVSHELRTPLTPIKASAQLLSRRWEDMAASQRTELLGHIEERADHLARLVDDLLLVGQLSHADAGGIGVTKLPFDLAVAVRSETEQLALARTAHTITFAGPDTLETVTDWLRMRQIIDKAVSSDGCNASASLCGLDGEVDGETAVCAA